MSKIIIGFIVYMIVSTSFCWMLKKLGLFDWLSEQFEVKE